jgi:hypothetical protein
MYISNPESLTKKYECTARLGKYLVRKYKMIPLSINGNVYTFSNTDELKANLSKIPRIIRMVIE